MTKGKLGLAYGLFLLLATQVFAAATNDKSGQEATQAQPAATHAATATQQQKSDALAVDERVQVSKGVATRDLVLTLIGLLGFVGFMSFLLQRPKNLDKYDRIYAKLREEHDKRKAQEKAA
ncbi:MAG: hypothetical protein AAF310_01355 [Myxococcota bacterium]